MNTRSFRPIVLAAVALLALSGAGCRGSRALSWAARLLRLKALSRLAPKAAKVTGMRGVRGVSKLTRVRVPTVPRARSVVVRAAGAKAPAEHRAMSRLSSKIEPLEALVVRRQLGKVGPKLVEELDVGSFPDRLGEAVRELRAHAEQLLAHEGVVVCLRRPIKETPPETLEEAVRRLPDSPLKRDVGRLLALRAESQGLPGVARKVRPAGHESDSMGALLRDVKARQALPATGNTEAAKVPPLPAPEPPQGWLPRVWEAPSSGLPPLGGEEREVQERLTQELHSEIDTSWNLLGHGIARVCGQHGIPHAWRRRPLGQPTQGAGTGGHFLTAKHSEELIRKVETALGRSPTPGERVMIPTMSEQGHDVRQIAAILRGLK
jgi:hypothetical protein